MKSDVQIAKIIELEEEDAVLTIEKKINDLLYHMIISICILELEIS